MADGGVHLLGIEPVEENEGKDGQEMDATWLPEGMDPKSCYLLKIRLFGNPKKVWKEFTCFSLEKVVDSDTTNFKVFVEEIVDKYPPGYMEVAHVHYCDDNLKTFPEVKTDQELLSMFHSHAETKVVHMNIAYCDPSEPYEPTFRWDVAGTSGAMPTCEPKQHRGISEEDSYLVNPEPENEHVGINEEHMYLEKEPALQVAIYPDNDKDYVPEGGSESSSGSEDDSGVDSEIESETEAVAYDKEDPPMAEGSTYPNIEEFKLALSQHAIRHEFEYNTEKSEPSRFRAYCARKVEDNCPWRIHASTTEDMCTIKVKKNPFTHTCSSTRRKKKVKNASKHWVCAKVKDWLKEDHRLGAKELQRRIKEHYKIKIHYKRVFIFVDLLIYMPVEMV